MSSREPMWYCHECHSEMRPLMQPDPICASCHGSFVEKIEDPTNDPREFQHHVPGPGDFADDGIPPSLANFLASLTGGLRPHSPLSPHGPEGGPGNIRFEFHSAPNTGTRTIVLGGPDTIMATRSPEPHDAPTMSEFLRRENLGGSRQPGDINGALMTQYLLAFLGHGPPGRGMGPFAELFAGPDGGASSGRWGDYVFNQEALDQVITQLMENSAGRPVPATQEIVDNLPREVLQERSPLLDKDCAVCKEQFQLHTEDPDEQVIVTLPCKHPFHESCILPWLKSSGTCPVCRHALVEQAQQSRPPDNSPGPSGSGPGNGPGNRPTSPPPAPQRPRSPGNSGRHGTGGRLFPFSLFGGGSSGSRTGGGSSSQGRSWGS